MNKKTKIFTVLLAFTLIFGLPAGVAMSATAFSVVEDTAGWPRVVTLSGGPQGGPWYPVMVKWAEILTRVYPNVTWHPIEGSSIGNIRLVNEGVDADVGLAHLSVIMPALAGTLPATEGEVFDDLVVGNVINTSWMALLARVDSGHTHIKDVWNRRYSGGTSSSGNEIVIKELLNLYGITYDSIRANGGAVDFVSFNEMAARMQDNLLDIGVFSGDFPMAVAQELDIRHPVTILSIDEDMLQELARQFPTIVLSTAPAGSYSGQTKDEPLIGVLGTLMYNRNLPHSLVYAMTRVLLEFSEEMRAEFPTYMDYLFWDLTLTNITEEMAHPAVWRAITEGPLQ